MVVTDVRIRLVRNQHPLIAYAAVTFDGSFVVKEVKVVAGDDRLLVSMPSREIRDHCHRCGSPTPVSSRFCQDCGERLAENRIVTDRNGRRQTHRDLLHPLTTQFRTAMDQAVLTACRLELERFKAFCPDRPAVEESKQ